jgi:hypothetical protein
MISFVYQCEECPVELRFLVSRALDDNINVHCPECEKVKRFNLLREGNSGKDWCRQVVIQNKKRRDEDGLYTSPQREQILAS